MGRKYSRVLGFDLLTILFVLVGLALSSGCEEKRGLKIGEAPPELSTNDIHEKHVSLSQFQGKVVIVCFWTDTCCGDTLKHLEPLYHQYQPKGLEVLAIHDYILEKLSDGTLRTTHRALNPADTF
jgi:AhpC/TSA family